MIVVLAMIASAVIAVSYLVSPGRWFHWANALLWPFLAISNAVVGWWPQAAMSVTLGLGGMLALVRRRLPRRPRVS